MNAGKKFSSDMTTGSAVSNITEETTRQNQGEVDSVNVGALLLASCEKYTESVEAPELPDFAEGDISNIGYDKNNGIEDSSLDA